MNSEKRQDHLPGRFAPVSAIALFIASLLCFYSAWWAHQKGATKASDLAIIQGEISSARIEKPSGGLPLIAAPQLVFSLNDRGTVFFVSRTGARKEFEALTAGLKPGASVKLWAASAGTSSGSRLEARQVVVNGQTVYPLSAWSARFRLMQWFMGGLFVLLFAASFITHFRSLPK